MFNFTFSKGFKKELLKKYNVLVEDNYKQELFIEELREKREKAKYEADLAKDELYITKREDASKKEGAVKLTEATLDAMIGKDDGIKEKRNEVTEADNEYKRAIIKLGYIQNQMSSIKLELSI